MKRVTFKERVALADELKKVIVKEGDQCAYTDGMSDTLIAKKMGFNVHLVRYVRDELFGKLTQESRGAIHRGAMAAKLADAVVRVDELEARVKALEDAVTAPKQKPLTFNTPQPWKAL